MNYSRYQSKSSVSTLSHSLLVTGSPECSNEEKLENPFGASPWQAETHPDVENHTGETPVGTEFNSVSSTLPPSSHLHICSTAFCCLTRSQSHSSLLSNVPRNNLTRAASLPSMKLHEYTPNISVDDFGDETYMFQCSCPGLYQCSVTNLVFVMKGEGDVVYRTVPWNRRLLAQHHKKPAGPLFDITCPQQSVCQLHILHCEVISTGGGQFLQVAHVKGEGIEFIHPHKITKTHAIINIEGFSAYGNVKDEDSPPDPVQSLVLLFYKPPNDCNPRSVLSVFMLPRNVVFPKMRRDRKKSDKTEIYIETTSDCKLHPKQAYTLATDPEHDLVKVKPKQADFQEEFFESYFPSFQVLLKKVFTDINLCLRDKSSSTCVWETEVCLFPTGGTTGTVKSLDAGPEKIRRSFIESISGPVLRSLLDHLLEKKVLTKDEVDKANTMKNRKDKASWVFDTVSRKGGDSEMFEVLREEDPFLYKHLDRRHQNAD
uniref:FIIND domain-containing protein n=1 Tax=Maylandia zebra TaxID=106582 RepID=A0A3P9D4D7_9CICH